MARKMGRNLKRAAAVLMASAAIALCAVSPAWGEERAGDIVNVTVPTRIDCALGADGTVTSPGGLEVVNNGPQDLYVGASTVDDFGQKVEFAMDLGGSPLLSRAGGKDVEGEVEFAGSSRKGLVLSVSKLNRMSHAALMDAAAQGEAPMFTVGFRFTSKALQGSMSISGEAKLGKTLTATVSGAQADAKLAYRWYRDGQLIAGAETASYTTNEADQGKKLKCEAYDAAGRYVGGVSAEVGPVKGLEAFAVFSADDGSLNFYKRINVPKAGEQFEGRTVTEVYTGFENKEFAINNNPKPNWSDVTTNVPWFNRIQQILSARIIDKNIKPYQLSFWFTQCNNMTQVDLSNLDASRIKKAIGLFGRCHKLHTCILPSDMNNLTDLSDMFYECRTLNEVDLTCIGTSSVPRDLFSIFNGCLSLKTIQIPRQIVRNLGWGFAGCKSITDFSIVENWDVSHVAGTHDLFKVFAGCTSLTSLNLSKWKTSQSLSMEGMFSDCSNLKTLDISGFNTATVTNMAEMFSKCINLRQVTLGDNFAWKGIDGLLPAPNPYTIPGADGKWYALSDKKGYAPADIPSNKADTYVASPDMLPKEAFAVFSADDGSLNFYKRSIVPTVGSQFEGKTVTSVYTNFEDKEFDQRWTGTNTCVPWADVCSKVTNAMFVDTIQPKSMAWWFHAMPNLVSVDFTNLDTSGCTSFKRMFSTSPKITDFIKMNELDTSSLKNVQACFDGCHKITTNSMCANWDVSNVELFGAMFYNTPNLTSFDASNWRIVKAPSTDADVSGVFFSGDTKFSPVRQISVSESVSNYLKTRLFFNTQSANISGADGYWYDAATGEPYKPEEIPSNKAATYVAVNPVKAPTVTISGEAIYGSTLTARVSGQPADTTATSYQWQYYNNGDWRNTGLPGGNTATLTLTSNSAGTSCEGFKYRCVVTTTAGKKRVPQGISQAVGPVDAAPTGEAFAVYSAYDKSLNFYKRTNVPSNGDWYDGRTATEVYRDIETTRYYDRLQPGWRRYNDSITKVRFFEPIRPISTSYWFYGFTTANIDLSKLYTSSVTDMSYMFYNCSYAPNLGVSHFDTSNVTNMNRMFYNCSSVSKLDLANFDTSNVTNMNYMFGGCSSLTTIDMSGFDTSNVSNMDWMYSGCSKLRQVTLGAKFAWKSTYGYLPTPSGGQWYAASDGRGYAPEDIPSNKADTYYASKSLLPVTADEAPEAAMPDVEPGGDAAGTGADPEVEADAISSEAVVPGEAENEEAERKPDEDVGAGSDGDEKLDESSSETASAAASPPEEDCLAPVTSDEAQ